MTLKPEMCVFLKSVSTFMAFQPQFFKWSNSDVKQIQICCLFTGFIERNQILSNWAINIKYCVDWYMLGFI